MVEFHGEFPDNHLPPKRILFGAKGAEFMQSRRPIFEEYLQKLLQMPNLKGSDLLHTFLRSPYDFSSSNASYMGYGNPPLMVGGMVSELNLGRMIRRTVVPLRLRKERGQHLEQFLTTFINSTSTMSSATVATSASSSAPSSSHASPSISASSQSSGTVVGDIPVQRVKTSSSNLGGKFEWTDMTEEGRRGRGRCLTRSIFGNNFDLPDVASEAELYIQGRKKTGSLMKVGIPPTPSPSPLELKSTFDCFLYLAVRVFGAGELVVRICLALGALLKNTLESFILWLVSHLLRKGLSTPRIALLLRLLKTAVFTPKSLGGKQSRSKAEEVSKKYMEFGTVLMTHLQSLPFWIRPVICRIVPGLSIIHSSLQSPQLNKQLAYSLLDLLAVELFPELIHGNEKA
ncbi:hypothetical protein J437_LFUL001268 [Ladona fulva]|uniref:PX domain-containing protein n=1 Tax=Ladona fulva TaxID=123851 RepID=A0A8K0JUP1_LADFU|nr:hypothetical protein J437_LFUL001268 [Ladona fulva]